MALGKVGRSDSYRLITKSNTVGQTLSSVSVTSVEGGTSPWAQVIASTSADILVVGVGFYCTTGMGNFPVATIEIGYGGAGSESSLDKSFMYASSLPSATNWFPGGWVNLPVPQRISSGQRVAVRLAQINDWGAAPACVVYLATVPYANLEGA